MENKNIDQPRRMQHHLISPWDRHIGYGWYAIARLYYPNGGRSLGKNFNERFWNIFLNITRIQRPRTNKLLRFSLSIKVYSFNYFSRNVRVFRQRYFSTMEKSLFISPFDNSNMYLYLFHLRFVRKNYLVSVRDYVPPVYNFLIIYLCYKEHGFVIRQGCVTSRCIVACLR